MKILNEIKQNINFNEPCYHNDSETDGSESSCCSSMNSSFYYGKATQEVNSIGQILE